MRRTTWAIALMVTSGLALGACVGGKKEEKAQKAESLNAYVLDKPPGDVGKKLGINYDNKATLLGAKVKPEGPIKPGQRVKITMYWKSAKPIGKGWKLFTHVLDGSGKRILNIDNVGPLRKIRGGTQALAPSKWEPGKIYVDEQSFTMPKKLRTSTAQVTVGIWKGKDRLPTISGPHDRKNRGIVATLNTTPKEKKPSNRTPKLRVDKLEKGQKITIDGKLDEAAWQNAPSTGPFVDVRTGRKNTTFPVNGSAKVLWDDKGMYVGFEVKDENVEGGFDKGKKDPHLWTKDTVEVMIDPDGNGDNKDYYEIQINPQNLVFDSRFDAYNQPRKHPDGPFGHEEWSANVKSAVVINGTMDKKEDKDQGYVVEAMIPWKSFDKAKQSPPEVGQTWRVNFYAMQQNGGVAWSPILGQGNFHRASRFGELLWAEKGWTEPSEAAKKATTAPSAAPPGASAAHTAGSGASAVPAAAKKTPAEQGAAKTPPAEPGTAKKPPTLKR